MKLLQRKLTRQRLLELLYYSNNTGLFQWNISRGSICAGAPAGKLNNNGYITIRIDGVDCYAHRLAFLYNGVKIPAGKCVDHIDGVKTNNEFANLRLTTSGGNAKNKSISRNNSSGFNGVIVDSGINAKTYRVRFYKNKKRLSKSFKNLNEAVDFRNEKYAELGYSKGHGKTKPKQIKSNRELKLYQLSLTLKL
jgi:hypothetical protein